MSHTIKRRIFFPEETATKLDEINKNMVRTGAEFRVMVEPGDTPDCTKRWFEIEQRVRIETEKAVVELEREFRFLLGDKEPNSSHSSRSAALSEVEREGGGHLEKDT